MKAPSEEISPYLYYTVSELSVVENATFLKNVTVKTVGYFKNDRLCGIDWESTQEATDGPHEIALDFMHQNVDFAPDKIYLILGTLFTVKNLPTLAVKKATELNLDREGLILYHEQRVTLRERSKHYQDLKKIVWQSD